MAAMLPAVCGVGCALPVDSRLAARPGALLLTGNLGQDSAILYLLSLAGVGSVVIRRDGSRIFSDPRAAEGVRPKGLLLHEWVAT